MITRKNISNSYLSKKKRNRNRNKNNRVKQIGGAVSDDKLKERLNFFNEFGITVPLGELRMVNEAVVNSKQEMVTVDMSGMLPIPIAEINHNNSILTYVNLHGCLNGNVEQVPTNTIICFLSPIEETFYINDNEPNSFTTFIC